MRAITRHEAVRTPQATVARFPPGASATSTGEPTPRPAWTAITERAVAAAAPPEVLPSVDSWAEAFLVPLRPFLTEVRDRLVRGAGDYLPGEHADLGAIAETFTAVLGPQLARMAVRALVLKLSVAQADGRLTGRDGRERFADFLVQQSTPAGLVALFAEYPVLARLLGTASQQAAEAGLELLTRFTADRAAVVKSLLGGIDPGPVVAVQPGLGDRHRQGRSVTAVSFADGRKVIYKPRSIKTYLLFRDVAGWLNQRVPHYGLRTAHAVARPGYGWLQFIDGRPLARPGQAEDFYRREGVLLAALYALQASDIHCQNLIACGDQPVLVDAETLFHPVLQVSRVTAPDPAAEALAASTYRTALLPNPDIGEYGLLDQSGMGGDQGEICPSPVLDWDPPATDQSRLIWRPATFAGAANRPHFNGQTIEPADHEAAVLEGFRLGYDAIAADRTGFTRLLESHRDIEIRIIIRPTREYARLLDESTHPDLLRDACDRADAFDVLSRAPTRHRLWRRLAEHEQADLWAGDIPLLTGRPGTRDIWTSAGQRVTGLLDRPGLSEALGKIAAMGEADRRDQEWVISASLATRRPPGSHRSTEPVPGQVSAIAADPGRLLAAACGLADQIVTRGKSCGEGAGQRRVNWPGLQLVDNTQWMVLPMGAGLADGYVGVALFLAQLAELTGVGRYAEEARRAVSQVPRLCKVLADRPDLLAAIGCGGIEGLGGISYGLARMATLLDDAELRRWAQTAVQVTAKAASLPGPPGWVAGTAGCLAAMTAIHAELNSAVAATLAEVCADQLAELVEHTSGQCVPHDDRTRPGFATGAAGIGWALARFAATRGDGRYLRAGHHAVRYAMESVAGHDDNDSPGWCSGTAGLLVARACLASDADTPELRRAVRVLAGRPVLRDLSLCHGELGIAEALTVLAINCPSHTASQTRRQRTGLILDVIDRHARYCGTPGGITTPGLLSGLAGIGYELLRLGFAERVPSVLLLEPTPRAARPMSALLASKESQPRSQ